MKLNKARKARVALYIIIYYNQEANNIEYTTAYVMATFFTHKKQLTLANKQLLTQVLKQAPNNVAALNLLAIDAYNRGEYKVAIYYWEKLIPLFDPQSEDAKILLQMIGRAQKNRIINLR